MGNEAIPAEDYKGKLHVLMSKLLPFRNNMIIIFSSPSSKLYFIYNLIFKSSKGAAAVPENTTLVFFTARHRTFASIGGRQLIAQLLFFPFFSSFFFALYSQGAWSCWWYEGCMAQLSGEEECLSHSHLSWLQRYKVAPMDYIGCVWI